jgi:hypothetical protein
VTDVAQGNRGGKKRRKNTPSSSKRRRQAKDDPESEEQDYDKLDEVGADSDELPTSERPNKRLCTEEVKQRFEPPTDSSTFPDSKQILSRGTRVEVDQTPSKSRTR